jgi:hypothetical protein
MKALVSQARGTTKSASGVPGHPQTTPNQQKIPPKFIIYLFVFRFVGHISIFTLNSQLSEGDDFNNRIAKWGLYMAEGVFGLATVAVAKLPLCIFIFYTISLSHYSLASILIF